MDNFILLCILVKCLLLVGASEPKADVSLEQKPKAQTTFINGTLIAFSAARTTNVVDVPVDTLISYDRIDTLVGGGFDGTTFSAPVQGVYLFFLAGKGSSMAIHLKVNGATMRSVIRNDGHDLTGNSSDNSVVLELDAGDLVQTYQSEWGGDIVNESPTNGIFTSFTGILLHETTAA